MVTRWGRSIIADHGGVRGLLHALLFANIYALQGEYRFNSGQVYKGEWKNDKQHGQVRPGLSFSLSLSLLAPPLHAAPRALSS